MVNLEAPDLFNKILQEFWHGLKVRLSLGSPKLVAPRRSRAKASQGQAGRRSLRKDGDGGHQPAV